MIASKYRNNEYKCTCPEILGANPPSSPTLHPLGPFFSEIIAYKVHEQ